mmetsp:Transcript_21010/g.40892  ORF Transcript_21010/g.40892 Transcript_21010/m.40892 type:complete len:300 (-) Transcript_21010:444-1343(-)
MCYCGRQISSRANHLGGRELGHALRISLREEGEMSSVQGQSAGVLCVRESTAEYLEQEVKGVSRGGGSLLRPPSEESAPALVLRLLLALGLWPLVGVRDDVGRDARLVGALLARTERRRQRRRQQRGAARVGALALEARQRLAHQLEKGDSHLGSRHARNRPGESEADDTLRVVGSGEHDILQPVRPNQALGVDVVGRDAVDVDYGRVAVEGVAHAKGRVTHPQLRRPANPHRVARHNQAVRKLCVLHCCSAQEPDHVKDAAVLLQAPNAHPGGVMKLHLGNKNTEIRLADEKERVVMT